MKKDTTIETLFACAASYNDTKAALADFDAVKKLYDTFGRSVEFDAAVIEKNDQGTIKIVRTREEPSRHGAKVGLSWGLATGLVAALFPAVGIWAGLAAGGGLGAFIGALAGHVNGGMSRHDLKSIGEHLDRGQAGLIVVYKAERNEDIGRALKAANVVRAQLRDASVDDLARAVNEAKSMTAPKVTTPA